MVFFVILSKSGYVERSRFALLATTVVLLEFVLTVAGFSGDVLHMSGRDNITLYRYKVKYLTGVIGVTMGSWAIYTLNLVAFQKQEVIFKYNTLVRDRNRYFYAFL